MSARGPGQSTRLLLAIVQILAKQRIDYAVIGAMAAAVHGVIRATLDADAVLSITLPKLGTLGKALRSAGFETQLRRGDANDPIPALLLIRDTHGNRVDLLAGLRGLDPQAFARASTVTLEGTELRVIGREDFIAMKCFAGGPQDLADAKWVLKSQGGPLDVDLLRRATRRFGRPAADALELLLAAARSAD